MKNKIIILFIFLAVFLIIFFGLNLNKKKELEKSISSQKKDTETSYNSNIILDVNYSSVDMKGNEYIINAEKGEIDFTDSSVVYLTNVNAVIKPKLKDVITIKSNFGKYNINNFDTIFTKNVIINYVDNKIVGEYLDFSINRNSMIMSKNVIYSNQDNVLKSDVIEVNLETKDTKIFMYEKSKKVNIKSKNKYGNN